MTTSVPSYAERKLNEITALINFAQTEEDPNRKAALFALAAIKADNLASNLKALAETYAV